MVWSVATAATEEADRLASTDRPEARTAAGAAAAALLAAGSMVPLLSSRSEYFYVV